MKIIHRILLAGIALLLSVQVSFPQTAPVAAEGKSEGAFEVTGRGADHRVWSRVTAVTNLTGHVDYRNSSYTELETGMHYLKDGEWVETKAEIQLTANGAAATNGPHKVFFSGNLNSVGAVDLTTPDGKRLRSRILGLSYFDASTGQAALIAETKDSSGLLFPPNQILFTNAFDDVDADVQYLYTKAGLEQNIVLRAQPPAPAEFGLNPATTRLQVLTEFFDPPAPQKKSTTVAGTNQLTDESLDFGQMKIGPGKAFAVGASGEAGKPVRVAKQWGVLDGRTFLVEEVPFVQVDEKVRSLLNTNHGASFKPQRRGQGETMMAALKTLLPKRTASRTGTAGTMQMARLEHHHQPGFVLDYEILAAATNFTFKGDTTYYVTTTVNLSGTTTIEGGTVIKFTNSPSATISLNGPLVWQTDAYRPAVFTTKDDNSVGDWVSGSSGNPARNSATYLNNLYVDGNGDTLWSSPIKYARFSHAGTAMAGGDGYSFTWPVEVWHSQFVNCGNVVAFLYTCGDVRFNNVLASGCGTLLNPGDMEAGFYLSGVHVTVDACDYLSQGSGTTSFTNTIFTGSISLYGATLDHCAQFSSSSGVYQIVGAGSYYLANNSTNRNAGTTNINANLLADLQKKSTYPPMVITTNDAYWTDSLVLSPRGLCDTNAPDQGYHYDVLDYALGKVALKDATITVEPGTAIGTFSPDSNFYGVGLFSGSQFLCEGTPTALNRIVHYNTVQEQANTNWASGYSPAIYGQYVDGTPTAVAKFRFTDWSILGQGDPHFYGVDYDTLITVSDCQFHGGQIITDVPALNFTNCLFERVYISLFNAFGSYDLCLRNNLFYGGELELIPVSGDWTLRDNLFDHTTVLQYEAILIHDHNGYVTGSDRLTPTNANDVVASLVYQKGRLGNYYQPTNSAFINAGSVTNAGFAGLYHYTTTTNQVKEAGSHLDIGYHYVALNGNGNAVDSDGDGLADYSEDSNGSGAYETGDLSNFQSLDSDGDGLPDVYEVQTTHTNPGLADTGNTGTSDGYKDPDGDGLTNLEEMRLGKNPLVPNVAAPIFSPVGGSYPSETEVTVSCPTAGATIHYTLDGQEPTESDAVVASGSTVAVETTLTVKAKAWKTSWTTSDTENQSYRIEESPSNLSPTVTIAPAGGGSFLASDSIEILVEAADADGVITNVQLFHNDFKVAETTNSPLRYLLNNVVSGTFTFTAKAIDDEGAVTLSDTITITNNASGPVVSLVGVQPFFTSSPGTLLANIVGVNPGALTNLTLNGNHLVPVTGEFSLSAALVEGSNRFILVATDNQSRTAQATNTVYLDSIAPSLSITNPANYASFGTARVNVRGSFTETSLKQISVNGVLAFTSGNYFEALNVPMEAGTNIITATAEDIAGNIATNSINLTGTTNGSGELVDPVQLDATPVGGFTPLEVTFTPHTNLPGTLQEVFYDFEGDNILDLNTNTLQSVTHTYTNGEYFPVVTIQTSAGWFSSAGGWNAIVPDRLRINVQAAPVQLLVINITDPVDLKWTATSNLYVLSQSTATITEFDASTNVIRSLSGIGGSPSGLDVDGAGNVYVAMTGSNQVWRFIPTTNSFVADTNFGFAGHIGLTNGALGTNNSEFDAPFDVAVSPSGAEIAVSDSGNHRIQRFNTNGVFVGSFGQQGGGIGGFDTPRGLTYDSVGYLYIVDSGNDRIVLSLSSTVVGASGTNGVSLGQFQGAVNLAVGNRGIYVADTGNDRLEVFEPLGSTQSPPFGTRLALAGQFSPALAQPHAVSAVSNLTQEEFYIADTENNRVLLVQLPSDNPEPVWSAMTALLIAGDIAGAIPYFASTAVEDYRQTYFSLGTAELMPLISSIPAISPVFIERGEAQYYFQQTVDGVTITFPINFVKENGTWKILEY